MFSVAALREADLVQGLRSPAGPYQCNGKTLLRSSFYLLEVRAVLPSKPLTFCIHFTEMFFPSTMPQGHVHLASCQVHVAGSAPPHPAVQAEEVFIEAVWCVRGWWGKEATTLWNAYL